MLRACPHHGFSELTQIDTFYNGLNEQDQDSLNATAGGNLLSKTTREALKIIENKSKVRYSRGKSNVSRVNTNSREISSKTDDRIDKLADQILNLVKIVNKQVITLATVKAIEKSCVICGGARDYYDCIATDSNQSSVCAATGTYNRVSPPNLASNQMAPPGFAPVEYNQNRYNQNQGQGNNFKRGNNFQGNQGYRAPMNHVPNFQNQGFQNQPFQVPNNHVQQGIPNEFSSYIKFNESLIRNMQTQINVLRGDFNKQEENLRKNLNNDMRSIVGRFFQNQALTSGTLLSNTIPNPKDEMKAVTTRSGLAYEGPSIPTNSSPEKVVEQETEETTGKEQHNCQGSTAYIQPPVVPIPIQEPDDKLFELAKVPLNENCSAMLLKKLFEKLGDPGKFLILCDFSGMDVCHALADLSASINLMPLSIWEKHSLPELTPTRMTLELADRSITRPKGLAKDIFVKVGKFHFPTDFLVVDFEADPRVPLILGRSFLRTGRALINVYGEEITLRVNDESVTFNLNQTMRYSSTYDDNSMNRIDVIDIACEEYAQDVLDFKYNSKSGNPTLVSNSLFSKETKSEFCKEPIVKSSSPTLTPFGESDFFLEEIKGFLKDELIPTGIKDSYYDLEGDILYLEKLLNDDPSQLPPMDLKQAEETKGIDFMGPFPSLRGNKYILVAIDYFSKWVEVKALPTNDARVVVKFLKSLFARFGTPRAIISDRGTHFCNYQFAKVMTKYGVTHRLATAYHPQMSGQVEVSNRGLKRILEKRLVKIVPHDHQKLQLNELNELRDQAYENSLIYKERTKKLHDSKIKNHIFNVGVQVLLFNSRLKIFWEKLKTRWSGPFTITQVFPYGTVELSQPDGLNFKVNGHRVKHYFGGDIPSK
nr:reverse transcriptase domain-containing protein [Tanacetum cinerariifolium]